MRTLPRIAVVLTTFNGERWIDELLSSVLAQVDVDVRIYVSDDASTDSTLDILSSWCQRNDRIEVLVSEKKFGAAGKNFFWAFDQLKDKDFDALAFADQDDVWLPAKLKVQHEILKAGYDGVSSNVIAFWPNHKYRVINNATAFTQWDYIGQAAGQGCTYLISRKLCELYWSVRKSFELSEIVHHDWFVYSLARAAGLKWYIEKQPLVLYRQHGENEVGSRGTWRGALARINKVRSGWYRNQIFSQLKVIQEIYPNKERERAVSAFYMDNRVSRIFRFLSILPFRRDLAGKLMLIAFFVCGWV